MVDVDRPTPAASALREVKAALDRGLKSGSAGVTPGVETQVANALHHLRMSECEAETVGRVETIAINLRMMMAARASGQCNLMESRYLRLRKLASHIAA